VSAVLELPIARLATSLAPLRGPRTDAGSLLAPLPLRVAATGDGTYEVLDGFKRLAHWTHDGHTHVPVVVEDAAGVVRKARLLEANAPRRTLSPLDEARVVRSLTDDDQLTPTQIAKLLGRGRGWVDRRLNARPSARPAVAAQVDAGRLSATTAQTLATFPRGEQPRLADVLLRHGLRTREEDAFLAAWRVADDAATREALLRDPRRAVPEDTPEWRPGRTADARRLLAELKALPVRSVEPEAFVFGVTAPWCPGYISAQWRRTLRAAKVRYRNPEQLRHTFASTLLSRNAPPLYVQQQGGWRSAAVLFRVYARWLPQGEPDATPAQPAPRSKTQHLERLGLLPRSEHRAELPEVVDQLAALVEAAEGQLDRQLEGHRRRVAVGHLRVEAAAPLEVGDCHHRRRVG
jgi:integrase